jgi:hypothetical protein
VAVDGEDAASGRPPVFAQYESAEHGFAIQRPATWLVLEGVLGTQVAFAEPGSSDAVAFRANLNLVVRDLPDGFEPSAIFQAQVDDLAPVLTDPVLIDLETFPLADRPWQRVLIGYRDGIYALTLEQWCVLAETRSYLLSCTTTTGNYAQDLPVFEAMVDSLRTDGG